MKWSSRANGSAKGEEIFVRWMELRRQLASIAERVLRKKATQKVDDDSLELLWHLTLPAFHAEDPKAYIQANLNAV